MNMIYRRIKNDIEELTDDRYVVLDNGCGVSNPTREMLAREGWRPYYTQEFDPNESYDGYVHAFIRERYSDNDEWKAIREYLADRNDEAKTQAFFDYNEYVEQCKNRAADMVEQKIREYDQAIAEWDATIWDFMKEDEGSQDEGSQDEPDDMDADMDRLRRRRRHILDPIDEGSADI